MDQPVAPFHLGLLPQIAYVDLDDIALAAEVVTPDAIEDHITGQYLSRISQEQFQQLVLLRGQINGSILTICTVGTCI